MEMREKIEVEHKPEFKKCLCGLCCLKKKKLRLDSDRKPNEGSRLKKKMVCIRVYVGMGGGCWEGPSLVKRHRAHHG